MRKSWLYYAGKQVWNFQVTQKYQQFAHDDNISKNKFKRLAEELNVAKQSLKKSNQEKAALIAMLSHELGDTINFNHRLFRINAEWRAG